MNRRPRCVPSQKDSAVMSNGLSVAERRVVQAQRRAEVTRSGLVTFGVEG